MLEQAVEFGRRKHEHLNRRQRAHVGIVGVLIEQRHFAKEITFVEVRDCLAALLDDHLPFFDQIEGASGLALANNRGAAGVKFGLEQRRQPRALDRREPAE